MAKLGMTIGELARTAGVGVETVRYYQRLGLLDQPPSTGGYRRYSEIELAKLRYIKNAKALHLSLKDIAFLQPQIGDGPSFCAAVRARVAQRLKEVERKQAELSILQDELEAFLSRCLGRPSDQPCPVARDLTPRGGDRVGTSASMSVPNGSP